MDYYDNVEIAFLAFVFRMVLSPLESYKMPVPERIQTAVQAFVSANRQSDIDTCLNVILYELFMVETEGVEVDRWNDFLTRYVCLSNMTPDGGFKRPAGVTKEIAGLEHGMRLAAFNRILDILSDNPTAQR